MFTARFPNLSSQTSSTYNISSNTKPHYDGLFMKNILFGESKSPQFINMGEHAKVKGDINFGLTSKIEHNKKEDVMIKSLQERVRELTVSNNEYKIQIDNLKLNHIQEINRVIKEGKEALEIQFKALKQSEEARISDIKQFHEAELNKLKQNITSSTQTLSILNAMSNDKAEDIEELKDYLFRIQREYGDIIEKTKDIIQEKLGEKELEMSKMKEEYDLKEKTNKKELKEAFQEKLKVLERELSEKVNKASQQEKYIVELRMANASLKEELNAKSYELDLMKSEREVQRKKVQSLEKRTANLLRDKGQENNYVKLQKKYKMLLKEIRDKVSEFNCIKKKLNTIKADFTTYRLHVVKSMNAVHSYIAKERGKPKVQTNLSTSSFTFSIIPKCNTKTKLHDIHNKLTRAKTGLEDIRQYIKNSLLNTQYVLVNIMCSIEHKYKLQLLTIKEKHREKFVLLYNEIYVAKNKEQPIEKCNTKKNRLNKKLVLNQINNQVALKDNEYNKMQRMKKLFSDQENIVS